MGLPLRERFVAPLQTAATLRKRAPETLRRAPAIWCNPTACFATMAIRVRWSILAKWVNAPPARPSIAAPKQNAKTTAHAIRKPAHA